MKNNQEHLIHGISLLFFAAFMVSIQNIPELNNPAVVISVGVLYIAMNTIVDMRAKKLHIDRLLEYAAVAVLAGVVLLSL